MNVTITINKKDFTNLDYSATGMRFSAVIIKEGYEPLSTNLSQDGTVSEAIDNAMKRLIESLAYDEETDAVVTIILPENHTISVGLQQYFVDKYIVEKEIASVVFAQ